MTAKKILTRQEFRDSFMSPLEDNFGYKIHWNSKNLKEVGLESTNVRGVSYTSDTGFPIVMSYTQNTLDMLNTLIHEYGHSHLHNINESGYKLSDNMQEYEAESVAIRVFEMLEIEYPGGNYANEYYLKCSNSEIVNCKRNNREALIETFAKEISNIFYSKANLIKQLNNHSKDRKKESYKYQISCPLCDNTWRFKRPTKRIKKNAKGCYCPSCGKSKTLDKLIVGKI